jgi:DUF438 domain-containing protein
MDAGKRDAIKAAIRKIHAGEDLDVVKAGFKAAVKGLTEAEIAEVEEEVMREGASVEDVRQLCGAHLEVFREAMAEKKLDLPFWHPLHIQEEEHVDLANKLGLMKRQVHAILHGEGDAEAAKAKLAELVSWLGKADSNFLKQENAFFPVLEKHGIVQPPKIMWAEHDSLRAIQKRLAGFLAAGVGPSNIAAIRDAILEYEGILLDHVMKERTILFPAGLSLLSEGEWEAMRREFDGIGYFAFFPMPFSGASRDAAAGSSAAAPAPAARTVDVDTGYLSREELVAMLKALPVDISFVDAGDKVKYFNDTKERIFVRTKSVVGRSVQNCHPPKSVDVVTGILDDFRAGRKSHEDFWLRLGEKFVLIRYFAVRADDGRYLGALEVSQDIAPLKALEGEKRLR